MRTKNYTLIFIGILFFELITVSIGYAQTKDANMPQLEKSGKATQLFVDGKPFLIIGGELNNSSSSSMAYMQPIWQRMDSLHFNTVLTPLSWDLIEQQENKFDFTLVDSLIYSARQNSMHIVFLWLASWKNGMSSYMPLWVKQDYKNYPRAKIKDGQTVEVLSTLSDNNMNADAKAFAAVMKHIKEVDATNHTVLMMQVENESGILDDSRDRSAAANAAFNAAVPKDLINYLINNKEQIVPEIKKRWQQSGYKTGGNWEAVFGKDIRTDEIFIAWNYARYINTVATAGKKEYPIPMYVNAWLDQGDNPQPGSYPSGGALAHVLDIWKAGAPAIDLLAPDVYVSEYDDRCAKFTQRNNTLFIPEMNSGDDGARNVFIAIGKYNAIGVSPFGIDHLKEDASLGKSYNLLNQLMPQILQSQSNGNIIGFVVDEKTPVIKYDMNDYIIEVSLDEIFGHKAKLGYGLVMADGTDKFMGAGSGFRVRFYSKKDSAATVGIGSVDDGTFKDGRWIKGRRLNGDEDDQGRAWRFAFWNSGIEKCTVYSYK